MGTSGSSWRGLLCADLSPQPWAVHALLEGVRHPRTSPWMGVLTPSRALPGNLEAVGTRGENGSLGPV